MWKAAEGPFHVRLRGPGRPALLRGRRSEVFRKQNYSGASSSTARSSRSTRWCWWTIRGTPCRWCWETTWKSIQRAPRPIKEGDITAGARLMAMGDTTPDGLLNAHLIIFLFGEATERGSVPGTIVGCNDKGTEGPAPL